MRVSLILPLSSLRVLGPRLTQKLRFLLLVFSIGKVYTLVPTDATLFAPFLPPFAPKGTLKLVCGPGAGFDKIDMNVRSSPFVLAQGIERLTSLDFCAAVLQQAPHQILQHSRKCGRAHCSPRCTSIPFHNRRSMLY